MAVSVSGPWTVPRAGHLAEGATVQAAGCSGAVCAGRGRQACIAAGSGKCSHLRLWWGDSGAGSRGVSCNRLGRQGCVIPRSQAAAAAEELTVDNATVLVVGGGGCGLETLKSLAKAGSWVTAYQRHDKYRKDIEELGAMLAIGDVLDKEAIAKVFRTNSFDAVVCTVGGGTKDVQVDKDGAINLIDAAKKAGVKRFILISSIGVGNSSGAVTPQTYQVLEQVLLAKGEAEEYLKQSGLRWTILRPGGLLNDPATGRGILTEDTTIAGLVPRPDVASVIKQILFNKETELKTFSLIDRESLLPPTTSLDSINIFPLAALA